jgi:hypothetical protein
MSEPLPEPVEREYTVDERVHYDAPAHVGPGTVIEVDPDFIRVQPDDPTVGVMTTSWRYLRPLADAEQS